jgi:hypothetical protein
MRLYDDIRRIESEMETQGAACDTEALHAKLDQIDQRANHLELPTVYASNLYTLRSHIDLVRTRLAKIPNASPGQNCPNTSPASA